jgi:uncharacterized membrane protein YdjX (TVP38/TMEM64 family)
VVDSLWVLCLLLFLDGSTIGLFTTPLLFHYGRLHEPWQIALFGGAASAAGSAIQLLLLQLAVRAKVGWIQRFAPSRELLEQSLARFPSASFLALAIARATPLPDAPLKLVAAAGGYPPLLYALAVFLGSLPYYFALAALGQHFHLPGWVLIAATAAIVIGVGADWLRRRMRSS